MKKHLTPFILLFPLASLFMLGCTDEIFTEVVKWKDSIVYVEKPPVIDTIGKTGPDSIQVARTIAYVYGDTTVCHTDSVWISSGDADTLYVSNGDTILITNTDTVYLTTNTVDTVFVDRSDTVYLDKPIFYIDQNYEYYVRRFYAEADSTYGWTNLENNNLIMGVWKPEEIHDDLISTSYKVGPQWYAKISFILRNEYAFIPVYRELAHIILGKPYAPNDADDIMNPYFNPRKFTERPYDEPIARPYLDKLFEKEGI